MSGIIVDQNNDEKGEVVSVADQPVSMKVIQSIYNEITGKTEKIGKSLSDDHDIDIGALKQLNIKINQMLEQYNIVSKNCSVTLYHVDDCKNQYSSFERFELYDSSSMSPCENIQLEYNFLIVLPETKKPQSYKIIVNLHSRVALKLKAESEHGISRRFLRIVARRTGQYDIEYVDYTVARNFQTAIDQWYASVVKGKENKIIQLLQDKSEHFSSIFRILTVAIVSFAIVNNAESLIGESPTLQSVFLGGIFSFSLIYLLGMIALKIGSFTERSIDVHQATSGLRLNMGDKRAFENFDKSNSKSIKGAVWSTVLVIAINIFSTYLSSFLAFGS
ncbi:hypothetical protein [Halomonas tibetensis]|uniref:Uncharacterized protein n=1 Tax=Halomonas tibetensis TaxID=2259590 RepID=A0ABV7BA60_9GAMM